ncbi:MAG: mechanosensitive ion channel [Saprospiraceae bacterium]|nr:mechanosensitive ion channel [Saprospiraceae bacterium]MDW8228495.1 mechanosensitive ion channel [Saprospiraceae bacterium]
MDFLDKIKNGVLTELIARFSEAAPKLLFALLILLIGRVIAGLLRRLVQRVLALAGIDRLAERLNDIDLVQRSGMRITLSAVAGQMIFYLLMLAFVIFATDVLGIPAITDMVRDLIDYLPALFSAFVLFLLGLFLADMIRGVVQAACQSMGIPSARLIGTAVFYFLFITVAVSALAQAKINTGFIASNLTVIVGALAFAFAVGYGLAARDLVANYIASHYNRDKVQVGQEVRLAGVRGKVVHMDATSLILQTPDRAIIVPMSKMMTEKVEIFYPDGQEENLLPPESTASDE